MATNENDGPLSKLLRGLGVDDKLAPIAAVKRITERPVSLNPETLFKMAPTPNHMSDAEIEGLELWKDGPKLPTVIDLRGRDLDVRYEFHGTFRGKQQWTCWDDKTYDGEESALGSGDSKEMALEDLLEKIAPEEPEPQPKAGYIVHSSAFEPPTVRDVVDRSEDDVDFDSGLTDDDAR